MRKREKLIEERSIPYDSFAARAGDAIEKARRRRHALPCQPDPAVLDEGVRNRPKEQKEVMTDAPEIDKKQEKRKKTAVYVIFSWVCFLIVLVVTWVVDWIAGVFRGYPK